MNRQHTSAKPHICWRDIIFSSCCGIVFLHYCMLSPFENLQTTSPALGLSLLCAATKILWQAALLFFMCGCTWTCPMFRSVFGCTWLPCPSWVGGEQSPQQLWGVTISASCYAPGFAACLVHLLWQSSLASFPNTFLIFNCVLMTFSLHTGQIWSLA